MADFVGQRFGEYQLSVLLGRGNFGDVYLGEHVHEHTSAAIKVLQTRLSDQDLKGFIQEASTIFRLKHPHIVQLCDFGIGKDDTPYLAMNYAPHGTLRNRHPKGTCLPPELIASYVTPIASALQYAHDRGIIHRDIKPENILLGPQDEIWLSDFGIAVVAQSTRTGDTPAISGTVSYMAPEQLQGKPQFASDQYALGIMVYEWLCGEHPFKGNYIEIAMQHIQTAPPSLCEKIPSLSADIEQVVMIALAKDPNQRFATVQAFAKALEQASQKESDAVLSEQQSSLSDITTSTFLRTNDTSTFLKLSPDEARTGAKRQVTFSDEKSIEVSLPSGIQHGTSLRINDPENSQISKIVTIVIEPKLPSPVAITPSLPQPQLSPPVQNKQFSPPTRKTVSGKGIVIMCAVLLCIIVGVIFLPPLLRSGKNSPLPGFSQHNTPGTTNNTGTSGTAPSLEATAQAAQQAYNQGVVTNGVMFGFDAEHTNVNPYEQVLSPTTVGDLKQVWSGIGDGHLNGSPVVAYGMMYIGSSTHNFYAFDAKTGNVVWHHLLGDSIESTPAVAGGIVFVGSDDQYLYAFNAETGTLKWKTNLGNPVNGSPIVANGFVYVNINYAPGLMTNYLYALDAKTGKELWNKPYHSQVSVPAVANGVVYVTGIVGPAGIGSGPILAYNATTGKPLWSTSSPGSCGSDPMVASGVIFVNCIDNLYALNAGTGKPVWVNSGGVSDVAIENRTVYFSAGDSGFGDLYARDAKTGLHSWTVLALKTGSPTIANGIIYVYASDGNLYAFDSTTKTQLWHYNVGGVYINNFPTPVIANGSLYINIGNLFAFRLPSMTT